LRTSEQQRFEQQRFEQQRFEQQRVELIVRTTAQADGAAP
jgi:hypothetical protein